MGFIFKRCSICFYAGLFLLSAWVLTLVESYLNPYVYPYWPDSASYIEMARQLVQHTWPTVTPWDPSTEPDAIAQRLFPPGYALLIALMNGLTHDVNRAALWVVQVCACLIPVTFVWCWDRWVSRSALAVLALLMLASVGMLKMQHFAYSDVPALWLSILSLGLISRGLPTTNESYQETDGSFAWLACWWWSGLIAGMAYGVRNAALSLVVAISVFIAVETYRHWRMPARVRWLRAGCGYALGLMIPVLVLWSYNLIQFHAIQPYTMPVSERSGWLNLLDLGASLSVDLGVPAALVPGVWALLVPVLWWWLSIQGWWRVRREPVGAVVALGLIYVAVTEAVLWLSRTRFEWGGPIEVRHTLSVTWMHGLILALVLYRGGDSLRRRQLSIIACLVFVGLVSAFANTVMDWQRWGAEPWVRLHNDRSWVNHLGEVPPGAMVVSNIAPLFRVELAQPVREWELGGTEQDAIDSFKQLDTLVNHRPVVLWLACTSYTGDYSWCSDHPERSRLQCEWIRKEYPKLARCVTSVTRD